MVKVSLNSSKKFFLKADCICNSFVKAPTIISNPLPKPSSVEEGGGGELGLPNSANFAKRLPQYINLSPAEVGFCN